ncbi:unnamed protein product [Jaminaea pallidilutea]
MSVDAVQSTVASILPVVSGPKADESLLRGVLTASSAVLATKRETELVPLPAAVGRKMIHIPGLVSQLQNLGQAFDTQPMLYVVTISIVEILSEGLSEAVLLALLCCPSAQGGLSVQNVQRVILRMLDMQEDRASPLVKVAVLHKVKHERSDAFDASFRYLQSGESDQSTSGQLAKAMRVTLSGATSIAKSPQSQSGDNADFVRSTASLLASNSRDAGERSSALRSVMEAINTSAILGEDPVIRRSLLARMMDDNDGVLSILYSEKGMNTILSLFTPEEITHQLETSCLGPDVSTSRLRHSVRFLLGPYLERHPDCGDLVLRNVLWPNLLSAKSNRVASDAIFQALAAAKEDAHGSPMLRVLVTEVKTSGTDSQSRNRITAKALVKACGDEAVLNSNLPFLLSQSRAYSPTARILALAILAALPELYHGQPPVVNICSVILKCVEAVNRDFRRPLADPWDLIQEDLLQAIDRWQLEAMMAVAQYAPVDPEALQRQNLVKLDDDDAGPEVFGYKTLVDVYQLASRQPALPVLEIMFQRLGTSLPTFLASIWCSNKSHWEMAAAALKHLVPFVLAHKDHGQIDFQLIVPSLLIALAHSDRIVRNEALACLQAIATPLTPKINAAAPRSIWAYDTVYGDYSKHLKYLDADSIERFISDVVSDAESVTNDAGAIAILLGNILTPQKGQDRRTVSYQRGIMAFLTSHIVAWPAWQGKLQLLSLSSKIRDSDRLIPMLGLIRKVVHAAEDRGSIAEALSLSMLQARGLAHHVFAFFDRRSKAAIVANEGEAFSLLLHAIDSRDATVASSACDALRRNFSWLSEKQRLCALQSVLSHTVDAEDQQSSHFRATLSALDVDLQLFIWTLRDLRPKITDNALEGLSAQQGIDTALRSSAQSRFVAMLVELLETFLKRRLALSTALVAELFEVLRTVVDLHISQASDGAHLLHLTMSCLHKALESATPTADVAQTLRVDTIVDVVKTSHSPATSQQALLLLSAVAPLAPETVLHSAMPVFTFVGSSVLQRDNAYSFVVVERVLRSIVPPLVNSYQSDVQRDVSTTEGRFELFKRSRSFLRIFTDSAHHIPRHRRQKFFELLLDVVGPRQYSAAVLMLLVDRVAHKVGRQYQAQSSGQKMDSQQTSQGLWLPLAILNSQGSVAQLACFVDIWAEVERLWAHRAIDATQTDQDVFLDRLNRLDREHSDQSTEAQLQIVSLLAFLKAGTPALASRRRSSARIGQDEQYRACIESALRISVSADGAASQCAQEALSAMMALMPTESFGKIMPQLVNNESAALRYRGFGIVIERLPHFDAGAREAFSDSVGHIVSAACSTIAVSAEEPLSAIGAIQAIADQALVQEYGALSQAIPTLLEVVEQPDSTLAAKRSSLTALRVLARRLGPRILPYLNRMVAMCMLSLEKLQANSLRKLALEVLTALFRSVAAFLESHIHTVVMTSTRLAREVDGSLAMALSGLHAAIIKHVPTEKVLSATFAVWKESSASSYQWRIGLLDFLRRILRSADRSTIVAQHKVVFRFILQVLDERRLAGHASVDTHTDAVENTAIKAFMSLVLKLNELALRPLYLRIYDWAALDLSEDGKSVSEPGLVARRLVFYRVNNALHEQLQGLVSRCYATTLDLTLELLEAYRTSQLRDIHLWQAIVQSIEVSARYDEGTFWNPSRLLKLAPVLVGQLSTHNERFVQLHGGRDRIAEAMIPAVLALARSVPDESSLKALNSSLLASVRADDIQVRVAVLTTMTSLWSDASLSPSLLSLVPETVPHIAELMDMNDEKVVEATKMFVTSVEHVLGEPLDAYLR